MFKYCSVVFLLILNFVKDYLISYIVIKAIIQMKIEFKTWKASFSIEKLKKMYCSLYLQKQAFILNICYDFFKKCVFRKLITIKILNMQKLAFKRQTSARILTKKVSIKLFFRICKNEWKRCTISKAGFISLCMFFQMLAATQWKLVCPLEKQL